MALKALIREDGENILAEADFSGALSPLGQKAKP